MHKRKITNESALRLFWKSPRHKQRHILHLSGVCLQFHNQTLQRLYHLELHPCQLSTRFREPDNVLISAWIRQKIHCLTVRPCHFRSNTTMGLSRTRHAEGLSGQVSWHTSSRGVPTITSPGTAQRRYLANVLRALQATRPFENNR